MQIIRVKTKKEALREVRRRRNTPEGARLIHKIIKSRYGTGFKIMSMDPELYVDMLTVLPQFMDRSRMERVSS